MKQLLVYENFSSEVPLLMGTLYVDQQKGSEHYSFDYSKEWLQNPSSIHKILDPGLSLFEGRQYPIGKSLFGLFSDSAPDRWGRMLMERRERVYADKENRKPKKLTESDYLLGVFDELRMGALRFKTSIEGPFLSDDATNAAPPWTTLRTLEEASRNLENDDAMLESRWIEQLIKPGSSLGGSRPKATVQSPQGELWIAKFPSRKDDYDVGAWEMVAHDLAKLCGLNVPDAQLISFSNLGSTFLTKRFDRDKDRRIHFASAMTMLGKTDGASSADGTSYLDIASFIRSNGKEPQKDLLELWKRIVFNMAITNSDDHLRNHGFILTKKGWVLAPLYDVNPVPYGDTLSLNVDDTSNEISIPLAISSAEYFGIKKADAEGIASSILLVIKNNWERLATDYGLSKSTKLYMKPAFQACC